jgi:hypothetical protein
MHALPRDRLRAGAATLYSESLEVGITAGLDMPTATVISERGDEPAKQPPSPRNTVGWGTLIGIATVVVLWWWLR